ncbi:InlB B-repeat-containing protein, partial [Acholeplasma laidlawii]|uniref:InlB B-repeat-containing protein n=1 Tax=Acholeplasma laidlawii TaxID=2148 RepID=UPI0018C21450
FKDYDGSEIKREQVEYGSGASAPADPSRVGYTFTGWDKAFSNITGELEVTATYNVNTYKVTWKNEDGTILLEELEVTHGTIPEYQGATPTKESTIEYSYTFVGWSPSIEAVTGNVEYVAVFEATINKYEITFKDEDGTVLKVEEFSYGE